MLGRETPSRSRARCRIRTRLKRKRLGAERRSIRPRPDQLKLNRRRHRSNHVEPSVSLQHLTRSVFEQYNIVSPGDLKDAARKLDPAAQGQKWDNAPLSALNRTSAYSISSVNLTRPRSSAG